MIGMLSPLQTWMVTVRRATHVINLSLGLEMLNVTKPLKTGLFFTAFIRLELDKQEL